MFLFKTSKTIQEVDIRRPFLTNIPSELQKLNQTIKEDGRTEVPKKWLEMVLDECLELMNLREVIKLVGQYKVEIQQGMDEQDDKNWNIKIKQAKDKLIERNYNLFEMFQIKPQESPQMVKKELLPQQNIDELGHQLASLNQTRQTINILSVLIGKALNHQQVHKEILNIQNMIPKEMESMLTLLKSYLSLKQQYETDFLKKLKKIEQNLILEKEHLAPIEDHHDGPQINHIYERISTFLQKNKFSLQNLRIFNQEIVDCLRNFIRQILQPLQKQKEEEKDVINILTNIGDVKHELQRVLASYKDYIRVNDQNSQGIEIRLRDYEASDEELKKKIILLEKDNKEKADIISKLTQEVQEEKAKLEDADKKLEKEIQAHRQTLSQNETLQANNIQLDQLNEILKGKISTIRSKLQKLNLLAMKIQSEQSGLSKDVKAQLTQSKEYVTKTDVMKVLIEKISKATVIIQKLTSQLNDSKKRQKDLEMVKEELTSQLNLKNLQLEKIKELENEHSFKNQALTKTISTLKTDINEMRQREASALRENEELLKKIHNMRDYQRYFANEVLYDYNFYKKPIIEAIENRNYLGVKATRLLFRFDPLNKVNFHRYIDEVPHILILVKLENGRMLACYTNQPFKPQSYGEDAFIMVLNTGSIYELKKGAKAISYDEYYLLFGNSEIRLRSGESQIFSNFGIANSNFDNKGQSVDALFGEGKDKRELPITGYEIYQIIFEEER